MTGKVKLVQDAQTFGSGFTKREMVLIDASSEKYPQEINMEFVQDKVSLLDDVNAGDEVTVTFDIRGREYNGSYFNNLQAWKLNKISASEAQPAAGNPPAADEPEDDVPF